MGTWSPAATLGVGDKIPVALGNAFGALTSYTPAIGGTGWSIGNGTPVGGYLRASAYGSTRRWGTQAHARGSGVPVQREVDRVDRAVVRVVLRRGLERDVRLVHSHWQPHAQPTGCARADATAQRNDRRVATQHGMSQRSTILRNLM